MLYASKVALSVFVTNDEVDPGNITSVIPTNQASITTTTKSAEEYYTDSKRIGHASRHAWKAFIQLYYLVFFGGRISQNPVYSL